jgi:hypothetical protein
MEAAMDVQTVRDIVAQELPDILRRDTRVQQTVVRIARGQFADKIETESRFDRLLDELRRERETQHEKWKANQAALDRMMDEQREKWAANQAALDRMMDEQREKWAANQAALDRKMDEQRAERAEQDRKWEANHAQNTEMLKSIRQLERRIEVGISALGARWAMQSEEAFRGALKGILEDAFKVQVINVTERDATGEVFGHPDQVELDLIIHDSMLIICEIKSSMSRGDVYLFDRKVKFYERRHDRKATRVLIISPMVDRRAVEVARNLGIQVYSHADDVDPAVFAA